MTHRALIVMLPYLLVPSLVGPVLAQEPASVRLPRQVETQAIPGVLAAGATWEQVWQGADNADGIVGLPDGSVLFAQEQPATIRRLDPNGYDSLYVKDTRGTGAIAIDRRGRIIGLQRDCTDPGLQGAPCTGTPAVAILAPESERIVLADAFEGRPLGRINDLTVSRNDTVYFNGGGGTFFLPAGGNVTEIGSGIRSNGIILSPDEQTLYVTNSDRLLAFDVRPDGAVANQRMFATLRNGARGADGFAVDADGRVYVTAQAAGVQVFAPDGTYLGTIPTPRNAISAAFGGPEKRWLYVVASGMLWSNGKEFELVPGQRNNAKTIYRIPMLVRGVQGRAK